MHGLVWMTDHTGGPDYQYVRGCGISPLPDDHDEVQNPHHYTQMAIRCKCGNEIEPHEVLQQLGYRGLPYRILAAMKYLFRHQLKGHPAKDCRKAEWLIRETAEEYEDKGFS